jgi:hypothetical protein
VQLVDHPRAEKITMAHLSVKSVVVNDLHPRTLPHLHPKTARYATLSPRTIASNEIDSYSPALPDLFPLNV